MFFEVFQEQIRSLAFEVKTLREKDPVGYKSNKKTKLLAKVWDVIKNQIIIDPKNKIFNAGNTLPKEYSHYKRAKSGMPARYRLFFRYKSEHKQIIIIWMNDESTLRKDGSISDVYTVFQRMLKTQIIPDDWKTLVCKSEVKGQKKVQ